MNSSEPPHENNNEITYAARDESDQPGHSPTLRCPPEGWPDWADVQVDLSHRWAHMSFCWFCSVAAQLLPRSLI